MYLHKLPHPINCSFPDRFDARKSVFTIGSRRCTASIRDCGDEVFHLSVRGAAWKDNPSQVLLTPPAGGESRGSVRFDAQGTLHLHDGTKDLLSGVAGRSFGVCGQTWIFQFTPPTAFRCYGMGEKSIGMDRAKRATRFWNTDVWADFAWDPILQGRVDPMYVNVPWLIVEQEGRYFGILVDNPSAVFMATNPGFRFAGADATARTDLASNFFLGAPDYAPDLWIVFGPSLPELIGRFQRLVGTTPLPPLWALGHHQCRWGYASRQDLAELDRNFRKHRIPTDGLWLDIDYMDGFRVFTFDKKHWPKPARDLDWFNGRDRKVVAILDPGVKTDEGWPVYRDGLKKEVFCLTEEGKPYIGFVWPGDTAFPDFSLPEVRRWWAKHVQGFASTGMAGAWLDMNDPAVGKMNLEPMRFGHGTREHESFHNQYAHGMAMASREGFLAARPDERPFLLTRSACASTNRYAAVWTGDNCSNWTHLKKSIEISLHLALSGIPFNGPDVPGFGMNATDDLALAWYKAGFLFPFFRNHACKGTREQEPWRFAPRICNGIARYIRLRYKLLPYLYQLFIRQEQSGEAILRPLFHDFTDPDLGAIDDQFLVGPALMQAPVVVEKADRRKVVLPDAWWFDAAEGRWLKGGRTLTVRATGETTPLYLREGSLIPMQRGIRYDQANDLADLEVLAALRPGQEAVLDYTADDGISFAYQRGERSRIRVAVQAHRRGWRLTVLTAEIGWKPIRLRLVVPERLRRGAVLTVTGIDGRTRSLPFTGHRLELSGKTLAAAISAPVTVN